MLRDTHLVQRMRLPRPSFGGLDLKVHHVFGGMNVGMSPEAWKVLDPICTLDYMGAAEYEFGKVPQCLHNFATLARDKELISFAFTLGPHERELNWTRKHPRKDDVLTPAQTVVVYGICRPLQLDEVRARIRALAVRETSFYVKGGLLLTNGLDPIGEHQVKDPIVGWFEMDNLFMFFSRRTIWEGFCNLFEVPLCEVPEVEKVNYSILKLPDLVKAAVSLGVVSNESRARKLGKPGLLRAIESTQ